MGSANISKIERISAQNAHLWVDLCLNKKTGEFFGDVGGERYKGSTKAEVIEKLKEALKKVTKVYWRGLILIRVNKNRDDDDEDRVSSRENGKIVYGASCQFTYLRRERSPNPLKPKETIEREHQEDFENRVATERDRAAQFEWDRSKKKVRADEVEKKMREDRETLTHVDTPWTPYRENVEEFELPYTPDAWSGVQRIAQAIRDTQLKLDEFVREVTPMKLAALATAGDALARLPPAPPRLVKKKARKS